MVKEWILLVHWLCLVLVFVSALICYVFPSTGFGLGLFLGCYIRLLIRSVSILMEDFLNVNFHISTASDLLCRSSVWFLFFCESVWFVLAHGYSSSWLPQKLIFKKGVQFSYSVLFSVFVIDFWFSIRSRKKLNDCNVKDSIKMYFVFAQNMICSRGVHVLINRAYILQLSECSLNVLSEFDL